MPHATAKIAKAPISASCRKFGIVKLTMSQPAASTSKIGSTTSTTSSAAMRSSPTCERPLPAKEAAAAQARELGRLLDVARDLRERGRQVRADGRDGTDDDDRDQCGDQA